VQPPKPQPPAGKISRRPNRWLLSFVSALILLVLLAASIPIFFGHDAIRAWVDSPAGQRAASSGLGKVIKVDGAFAPLHLRKWTIETDSFTSTGWPGEALGSLNAYGIRAELDPAAVWRGAYRIDGIQIDHATISLLPPNDALKRPVPPKKPRPWYAFFLPHRFECGPIVATNAALDFKFQNEMAHIRDAHVQADLIGKDLNYTATSGVLEFPYLPPLRIERLEMLVTRPLITVSVAQLTGLDPRDPARLTLHGSIGMRENKAIDATVDIKNMPIEQILPADLANLIHGRASGHLTWKRDATGQNILSQGEVSLSGASIDDLSVFKQLALLHGNADLQDFTFDELTCKFQVENGTFTANIVARSAGRFALAGTIRYELKTKLAGLDLAFTDLPLQTWLPTEFKPRTSGVASASLKWSGHLRTIKNSAGTVSLNLDGARINDPELIRQVLARKGMRGPDEIYFKTAQLDFAYQDQTFTLTRAQLDLPGILTASVTGTLTTPANILDADVAWQGLTLRNWLPPTIANQISGAINGRAKFHVQQWKLRDGSYGGDVQLVDGELRYTSVQSLLARFVNDRRLLEIPLTRARFSWSWKDGVINVRGIDLRGGDEIGVRGNLTVTRDRNISGTLWVGTRASYLKSLAGLGDAVFSRNDAGLRWAKVEVSGTIKEPRENLSTQLMTQLHKHPTAVFSLGGKLISWYVGNLFGAQKDWVEAAPR
jgi:hypothetical protein